MQQIYKRTPMPKCDFNKVALQVLKFATFKVALTNVLQNFTYLH